MYNVLPMSVLQRWFPRHLKSRLVSQTSLRCGASTLKAAIDSAKREDYYVENAYRRMYGKRINFRHNKVIVQ